MDKKKLYRRLSVFLVCLVVAGAAVFNIVYLKKYDYSHLIKAYESETGAEFKSLGADAKVPDMDKCAENDNLALFISTKTAEIAVLDKRSGKVWRSNPADRDSDALANDVTGASLASQFDITYYNSQRKESTFYSYTDSVAKGQFKIEGIKDGIRVTYTLGDLSLGAAALPKYISVERVETFLSKVTDEKQKKAMKQFYSDISDKKGFLMFLESAKNSKINLQRILDGFAAAGYTEDDLKYDNEQAGVENTADIQYAVVPLEYRLDGDKLSVSVDTEKIEETSGIKIKELELLKFFGAAGKDESGYFLVPSGSGGLIDFNNGKTAEDVYSQPVYGIDLTDASSLRVQVTEPARLPVFGISKEDGGVLCVINDSESIATISADIAGRTNSYNFAYPKFLLRYSGKIEMSGTQGAEADMTIVDKDIYKGRLSAEYCFLTKDDADYSGMARYYRTMLENEGVLGKLEEKEDVPLYLDVLGAVEKQKFLVGIPYNGLVKMTTYEQAGQILDTLAENGIKDVNMKYIGWFNDGVNHDVPKNIDLISSLGSKKQMSALSERLVQSGGGFYPDVAFQLIYEGTWGYSKSKDSIRYIDGWSGLFANYNRATMRMSSIYKSDDYNMVSPNSLPGIADKFASKYEKLGLDGLSLRDLGDLVFSDKRRSYPISRPDAEAIVCEVLEKLSAKNLMISGGNSYALKYAKSLTDVPDSGNDFYIIDETVPFYEMVIHGAIDYAGIAANMREGYDLQSETLKMLEYGLCPRYVWSYEDSSELSHSAYESYYSTNYRYWLSDAVSAYQTVNEVYKSLRTQKIKEHIIHSDGVRETVYENGTSVIVNYTDKDAKVGNITVKAKSYAVKEGRA
ncbi:MAG: DUF5696 domain-containing protein [Oscillospiraceae bacterium]|nr:DUF5696 domain-containing protein [Oscillospiraceae bacterium]